MVNKLYYLKKIDKGVQVSNVGGWHNSELLTKFKEFSPIVNLVKDNLDQKIIFDSGMYDGNSRNYSQFRGSCFWNELISEEY